LDVFSRSRLWQKYTGCRQHILLLPERVLNVTLAVFLRSRAAKVFADANPPDCCRTDLDEGALAAKQRLMTVRWLPDEALGIPIKSGRSCKRGSIENAIRLLV
jgi:hypothetical protein